MKMKRILTILTVFLLLSTSLSVQAQGNNNRQGAAKGKEFNDVPDNHWAYEYIELMSGYGIINGYDDGNYKPDGLVSRAEFAKMMVLTMGLDVYNPSTPSFIDVGKDDWEYKYVEGAKLYLTGWSTSEGYMYRPDVAAVREDMAVAIIKGLGIDADETDMSVLEDYEDADDISSNLKKYVAAIINEGIMIGDGEGFKPLESITRAEAATLLARLITEEKVTFDETKIVYDDSEDVEEDYERTPVLEYEVDDEEVELDWSEVSDYNFEYYKVVVSASDSTPKYPDNGYIACIDDEDYEIKVGQSYNDGNEDLKIEAGETYYIAITAVYSDGKYTSNVIKVKIPENYERTPVLEYEVDDEEVELEWSEVSDYNFEYYKVVVSTSDSTPEYPENGYLAYLDDEDYEIKAGQSYNDGNEDLKIEAGETYYVAITAVYSDGKYTSNVIKVKIPENDEEEVSEEEKTPVLTGEKTTSGIALSWTETADEGLEYYKVVMSINDGSPSYSENGWLVYHENTYEYITPGREYHSGDFTKVESGQQYHIAITAVYNDGKYTSNVLTMTMP